MLWLRNKKILLSYTHIKAIQRAWDFDQTFRIYSGPLADSHEIKSFL